MTKHRHGFSLIELLVVVGIIAVLVTLLFVGVGKWRKQGEIARTRLDFAAIASALDAYRMDFGDYPRDHWLAQYDGSDVRGTTRLGDYLIGPGDAAVDGADGPGFRTNRSGGRVWGPYLEVGRFTVARGSTRQWNLMDRWGQPIQYMPQWKELRQNVNASASSNADRIGPIYGKGDSGRGDAIFDERESVFNRLDSTFEGRARAMVVMVGDVDVNNYIDRSTGEQYRPQTPYILFSAGPDGAFADIGWRVNGQPDLTRNNGLYFEGTEAVEWLRKNSDDIYNFDRW